MKSRPVNSAQSARIARLEQQVQEQAALILQTAETVNMLTVRLRTLWNAVAAPEDKPALVRGPLEFTRHEIAAAGLGALEQKAQ